MLHLWRQKNQQECAYALCRDILRLTTKILGLTNVAFKFVAQIKSFEAAESQVNYLFVSFTLVSIPHFLDKAVIEHLYRLLIDQVSFQQRIDSKCSLVKDIFCLYREEFLDNDCNNLLFKS